MRSFLSWLNVVQDCPDGGTNWRGSWTGAVSALKGGGKHSKRIWHCSSYITNLAAGWYGALVEIELRTASSTNWELTLTHFDVSVRFQPIVARRNLGIHTEKNPEG